jgi:hypothetical protein
MKASLSCKPIAALALGIAFFSPTARADSLVDASVAGLPGAYTYSYGIENQTDVGILLFSLTVTGDVGTIDAPTGWVTATGIPAPGVTLVEWISTDVPYDVPALGTMSGFSFESDSGPGDVSFSTFDENFTEFDGQTTGPVAPAVSNVPEPNTFAFLATALIGIYVRRRLALGKIS